MGENISEVKRGLQNSFSNIKKDMNSLKIQIKTNNKEISELKELIQSLRKDLQTPKLTKEDNLQRDILNKVKRNRKGLIKSQINELLNQNKSIPEIKELIVDRDNYCSKATFYRYISELKENNKLEIWSKQ
ncbi:MAG: hypothetical protein KAQ83_00025 [Nanoarchaeota archaeon]|nr:hypothetical protein [Nanoarchaeota archaeon]